MKQQGIRQKDLLPVTMRMHAANNNGIKIIGAAILRFSGQFKDGQVLESHQYVYVTRDSNKLYLSRETCATLGIIPNSFPTVGDTMTVDIHTNQSIQVVAEHPSKRTCEYQRRQLPPPKPKVLPFPATKENRKKIEDWLLHHYTIPARLTLVSNSNCHS